MPLSFFFDVWFVEQLSRPPGPVSNKNKLRLFWGGAEDIKRGVRVTAGPPPELTPWKDQSDRRTWDPTGTSLSPQRPPTAPIWPLTCPHYTPILPNIFRRTPNLLNLNACRNCGFRESVWSRPHETESLAFFKQNMQGIIFPFLFYLKKQV